MGYGTRDNNIRTFWPDDTDKVMYIPYTASLLEIITLAKEKWGDNTSFDNINITSEYIHTDCLGYDLYDPTDYTDFIVIEYTGN